MKDIERVKDLLWSIALADHLGDVPLEELVKALGFECIWDDEREHIIFPWPTDSRFPDGEAERFAALAAANPLRGPE